MPGISGYSPLPNATSHGSGITNLTDVAAVGARYGATAAIEPGKSRVVITDRVDAAMLDYVHGGGNVVLLTESGALATPATCQPIGHKLCAVSVMLWKIILPRTISRTTVSAATSFSGCLGRVLTRWT